MIEKRFSLLGDFHDLIVKRLIREDNTEDIKNYFLAAAALDLIDDTREKYFADFYWKNNEEAFGCLVNFYIKVQNKVPPFMQEHDMMIPQPKKYNNCEGYK